MEAAGEAVAAFCLRVYPQAAQVLVLCGTGNNGGDGLVAARVLAGEGVGVRVLMAGPREKVAGEAARAMAKLEEATADGVIEGMGEDGDAEELAELLSEADLIVDAVVGTGFKPPLRGVALTMRDALARVKVPVVAVDLPSGWDADSMEETVAGSFQGGCGGDVYGSEAGACVWALDGRCVWAGGGGGDRVGGCGGCGGE